MNKEVQKLFYALDNNDFDTVEKLIRGGVSVESKNEDGQAPLSYSYANERMFKLLLMLGADIHGKDSEGQTVLHVACNFASSNSVGRIIDCGADINAQDNQGCTPLMRSILAGSRKSAEYLISMGADDRIKDVHGKTPLEMARRLNINGISEGVINSLERRQSERESLVLDASIESDRDEAKSLQF